MDAGVKHDGGAQLALDDISYHQGALKRTQKLALRQQAAVQVHFPCMLSAGQALTTGLCEGEFCDRE